MKIVVIAAGVSALLAGAAQAELKICNNTGYDQSVSIGYKGSSDWTSEGWWNITHGSCANIVGGNLTQRYYYYRAEIDGGDFVGENYFFCTSPNEYTIVGDENCGRRGYDRESFREIDTGATNTSFTLTLVP